MEKVPCKPEGSLKRTRKVTMTTIWVAWTRYPHTENLSGEKCADTYQKTSKGKEGLGVKEAKATCSARESNVSEVIDPNESTLLIVWLVMKTTSKHCLVFNLA